MVREIRKVTYGVTAVSQAEDEEVRTLTSSAARHEAKSARTGSRAALVKVVADKRATEERARPRRDHILEGEEKNERNEGRWGSKLEGNTGYIAATIENLGRTYCIAIMR